MLVRVAYVVSYEYRLYMNYLVVFKRFYFAINGRMYFIQERKILYLYIDRYFKCTYKL